MTTPAKVLIVEDEKQIRRFVRVAVEEEGCQVAEAETMAQGSLICSFSTWVCRMATGSI